MLDEEYRPHEIAQYGERAQPALVARMMPHLRMTQLGNLLALLAIATSVGAVATFPNFSGLHTGSGWAVTALVCSIVLLGICTFQHLAWLRAMAEWKGERDLNLEPLTRASWVLHLVSYLVVLVGLWAGIAGSVAAGFSATAAVLLALSLVFMLGAQILAGVQYLRTSGPPGTIPAHLRRLMQRSR